MKVIVVLIMFVLFAREVAALIHTIRVENHGAIIRECCYLCGLVVLAKFIGEML